MQGLGNIRQGASQEQRQHRQSYESHGQGKKQPQAGFEGHILAAAGERDCPVGALMLLIDQFGNAALPKAATICPIGVPGHLSISILSVGLAMII